jgi:hypothetical protein
VKLIVQELKASELSQQLTPSRNTIVEAVRPHLYRHLWPSGSLKMQILTTSDVLVAESDAVSIADISAGNNYFHGYVRFYINAFLTKDTAYKFKLTSSGYTYADAAFIGWCNGFDLGKYAAGYTPANDLYEPLDLEVWERTQR